MISTSPVGTVDSLATFWGNLEKGFYLAASLRGQAQGVLGDLSDDKKSHFDQLVRSLEERFAPPNQSELYRVQLKERRQRASETLPELGQTIRRLVNKAYPTAPGEVTEKLAKEHFLDALIKSEMRKKIKQSRSPDLNSAICLAVERQNNQGSPGPSLRRTNNHSGKWKRKSLYLGSNTLNNEAGLYVELFINGIPAKFLIDTGATVSLVSDTLFEKLKSRDRLSLRQVTQEIIAANGESLKIIGKALFSVKLGSLHTVIEGVIAGLSVDAILGLDFLKTNGCKVDSGNKVMERDNQHIPLLLQGKLGVYRVAV
ncbi:uncharacterized protein [Mytilus edulis]|uniref:uncharacterized protein n=1 Tax=Mytilus edulis TaxID=6550 RepID=UPI0039F13C82